MQSKPQVIFVLGGPGAGKGTICTQLASEEGFVHLSAGDILRAERNSGSENAALISECFKETKIIPPEVTIGLLKKEMEKSGWEKSKFLIDGFPRNKENFELWNKLVGESTDVVCCLYFECPFETLEIRVLNRAAVSGRADDNIEVLKKRFTHFENYEKPIIEEFRKIRKLAEIDSNQPLEKVYEVVKQTLKSWVN